MKDQNAEALIKRTRIDAVCCIIITAVFAVCAVGKLLTHAPGTACMNAFLCAIFLLLSLIRLDIRKHGKPFAKSVICKLRILAVTVMCSGITTEIIDSLFRRSASGDTTLFTFEFSLNDRFLLMTMLLGVLIGIISELFVSGGALQDDMDQIA